MTKGKGQKTMRGREQEVFEALGNSGPKTVKIVKNTDKPDEVLVELHEPLRELQLKAIRAGTPYQVSDDAIGAMSFRLRLPTNDDTQQLEVTQAQPAIDTLPDTGQEGGMAEVVKTVIVRHLEDAAEVGTMESADPKKPCTHPSYVVVKYGNTEVCRQCGKVLKNGNSNGHEDVASLKAQNAELLDRVIQLEAERDHALEGLLALEQNYRALVVQVEKLDTEARPVAVEVISGVDKRPELLATALNEGCKILTFWGDLNVLITRDAQPAPADGGHQAEAASETDAVARDAWQTIAGKPTIEAESEALVEEPEPTLQPALAQAASTEDAPRIERCISYVEGDKQISLSDAIAQTADWWTQHRLYAERCEVERIECDADSPVLETFYDVFLKNGAHEVYANDDLLLSVKPATKVAEETCEPVEFTPLTPAELERQKSGRGLVVSPWQMKQWAIRKARAAGQKVSE